MNTRIFPYTGLSGEPLYADPSRVRRILTTYCEGDLFRVIQLAQAIKKQPDGTFQVVTDPAEAERYMNVLLNAISAAFELPRWDKATGQGAQDDDLIDLLNAFDLWNEKKNQSTANGATSPGYTGSGPSSPASPPRGESSTTTSGTASG